MCLHHGIKYGRPFNAGAGKILPVNCLAIGKSIHFRIGYKINFQNNSGFFSDPENKKPIIFSQKFENPEKFNMKFESRQNFKSRYFVGWDFSQKHLYLKFQNFLKFVRNFV